jgi:hypothetical protein
VEKLLKIKKMGDQNPEREGGKLKTHSEMSSTSCSSNYKYLFGSSESFRESQGN